MSPTGADLDRLPPEGRFAVRGLAAGLTIDAVAEVLREDGPTTRKHLRSVVRSTGGDPPPASAGDDVLRATLLPALEAARTPPARVPALRCPEDPIADALARGALDGPLLLAQAEHAADCARCMARLVDVRAGRVAASSAPRAPAQRVFRLDAPLVAGVLVGLGLALAYLFLR